MSTFENNNDSSMFIDNIQIESDVMSSERVAQFIEELLPIHNMFMTSIFKLGSEISPTIPIRLPLPVVLSQR